MISLNDILNIKLIQIKKDDKNYLYDIKYDNYIYPSYYYSNKIYYSNKYNTNENTVILLSGYKSVGKTFITKEKSLIFWPFYSLNIINQNYNYKYIYYCLKFINYQNLISKNHAWIDLNVIRNILIPDLLLNEQIKIINILENIEKNIKIEELNKYFNNYNIFKYFTKNKIYIIKDIFNIEISLIQQKNISNTLIDIFFKNIFENLRNNKYIKLKNIFKLNYFNKNNLDNNYHIYINYFNDLDYLQIKYIKCNIPLKKDIILFTNINKKIKYDDEFIFYYLLSIKHKIINFKNSNNIININLLNNLLIPYIDYNTQIILVNIIRTILYYNRNDEEYNITNDYNKLINYDIENNNFNLYNNIDRQYNMLEKRLNKFMNNIIKEEFNDNNLYLDIKYSNFNDKEEEYYDNEEY